MLIYTGPGYVVGVPARNLTDEEVERYGKDYLLTLGIYKEPAKPKAAENKVEHGPAENKDKKV
jgi:hypothetical protein